jgi:hypothetical protein
MKEVNYANIIDTLYNTEIANNKYEDTFIKKQIANVNIGLLEKGNNKKVESFLFNTEEEAEYYRSSFGGNLHLLQHLVEEHTLEEDPLNYGLDMDKSYITKTTLKKEGNPYYILNVSKQTTLQNGFRYIKELVLQHHNYKIYSDIEVLNKNNINVYSVKTDALTIHKNDVDKVKTLLKFSINRGGWIISKEDKIIFPSDKLCLMKNQEIKIKPLKFNA